MEPSLFLYLMNVHPSTTEPPYRVGAPLLAKGQSSSPNDPPITELHVGMTIAVVSFPPMKVLFTSSTFISPMMCSLAWGPFWWCEKPSLFSTKVKLEYLHLEQAAPPSSPPIAGPGMGQKLPAPALVPTMVCRIVQPCSSSQSPDPMVKTPVCVDPMVFPVMRQDFDPHLSACSTAPAYSVPMTTLFCTMGKPAAEKPKATQSPVNS
mmetsp:Transcript_19799/g.45083  ORF Transcript_19799/g.45083 Transcript_19799/m.45083 type:complete len:207 (+) Transcript_19799:2657-3277(+)